MGWESYYLVRFDFGHLLQGQIKNAYNLLIISPRGLQCQALR